MCPRYFFIDIKASLFLNKIKNFVLRTFIKCRIKKIKYIVFMLFYLLKEIWMFTYIYQINKYFAIYLDIQLFCVYLSIYYYY